MPIYEYHCGGCNADFELLLTSSTAKPECPGCHGHQLHRKLSRFNAGKRDTAATFDPGSCGTCGDPRGPGACSMGDFDD